ncbi:MAG: transcriptional regulator [Hyphomicrobiales bacterium]|nr:transcriptional regulator [Hyphomicrobiales bacterium]
MTGADETIHQPVRLRIMAALTALGAEDEGLDFARLKSLTGATDGNLGAHIDHLAKAGYAEVTKAFVAKRPRTTVRASPAGRAAFARHVAFLREILAGA